MYQKYLSFELRAMLNSNVIFYSPRGQSRKDERSFCYAYKYLKEGCNDVAALRLRTLRLWQLLLDDISLFAVFDFCNRIG